MQNIIQEITRISARKCGGWLGVFNDGRVRFGVTGNSADEVRHELEHAGQAWRKLTVTCEPSSASVRDGEPAS